MLNTQAKPETIYTNGFKDGFENGFTDGLNLDMTVSTQRISFDFNPNYINKYKGDRFDLFQKAFRPHYGKAVDMLNILLEGFSVTPVLAGGRTKNHFTEAWHMMIDFDTDDERSTLAAVANDPIVKKYGAFVYTTPSHTPETPRCRAVFILDAPIKSYKGLELAYRSLLHLFPHADQACKNAARLYYGSEGADYIELWNQLPLEDLREFAGAYKKLEALKTEEKQQASKQAIESAGGDSDEYHQRGLRVLLDQIQNASEGKKYNTRTANAFAIGGKVGLKQLDRSVLSAIVAAARSNSTIPDTAEKQVVKAFEAGIKNPG